MFKALGSTQRVYFRRRLSSYNIPASIANVDSHYFEISSPPEEFENEEVEKLRNFIQQSKYLMAITGAGVSTDSGIPDYRGPQGSYSKGHKPITHTEFIHEENSRKRYWARSMVGWQRFSVSKPNDTHYTLAKLETQGKLKYLVTQNVDRLHQTAGSKRVMDLHGRIDRVKCLSCHSHYSRRIVQDILKETNPSFTAFIQEKLDVAGTAADKVRADGDMDLGAIDYSQVSLFSTVLRGCLIYFSPFSFPSVQLSALQ
jgi:hypothetical protein